MLKDTILKVFRLEKLVDSLIGFLESKVEFLKYEVKADIAHGLSKFLVLIVLAFAANLFLFFISLAAAIHFGSQIGWFAGFGIMGGFYLVLTVVLILLREPIARLFKKQLMEIINNKE